MNAALRTPTLPQWDLRLMRWGAVGLALLAVSLLVAALGLWLARTPWLAIRGIQLEGDMGRNSALTVRANALPKLNGNFFSLDLARAKLAFESVPWVRQAVVQRVWPNQLKVKLVEHQPAAVWRGEDGNDKLVNSFGEIFEANVGDVADSALPLFIGPAERSAQMLAMYQALLPLFNTLDMGLETLSLSGRGSWRAEFDSGAVVELGRGEVAEVSARAAVFTRTVSQIKGRYGQPMLYADLRHSGGYALRLKNVITNLVAPAAGNSN